MQDPFSQSGSADLFSGLSVLAPQEQAPLDEGRDLPEGPTEVFVGLPPPQDSALPSQAHGSGLDLLGLDVDADAQLTAPPNGRSVLKS